MTSHDQLSKHDFDNSHISDRSISASSNRKQSLSSTVIQTGRSGVTSSPGSSSISGTPVNVVIAAQPLVPFIDRGDISPIISEPEIGLVAPSSLDRQRSSFHQIFRRHFTGDSSSSISSAIGLTSRGHSMTSEETASLAVAKVADNCGPTVSRLGRDLRCDHDTSSENGINDVDHTESPTSKAQDVRPERGIVTSCRTTAFSVEDILSPSKFTGGAANGATENCRSQYSKHFSSRDSSANLSEVRTTCSSPSPHHQPPITCPPSLWNPWIHRLDLQLRAANDVTKLDLLRGIGECENFR